MCRWTESISDKEHINKIFAILANHGLNTGNYAVIKTYTGEIIEGFYNGFFSQSNRYESYNNGTPEKLQFGIKIQRNNGIEEEVDALDIYDIKLFEKENRDVSFSFKKALTV